MRKSLLVVGLLALSVVAASAQPVTVTPATIVVFTPSADHAAMTAYEFGFFATGATDPIVATSIAKAALQPQGSDFKFGFPRLAFGTGFEHRLRGCVPATPPATGTVCSAWVVADKTTNVVPFPVSALRIQ